MKRKIFYWSIILEVLLGVIMVTLSFSGFGNVIFWLLIPMSFFAIFSLLLLISSSSNKQKKKARMVKAAVVVVQFDLECPKLKPLTVYEDYEYFIIPEELYPIRDAINQEFEYYYPFDFRCAMYANRFELMGVLKFQKDHLAVSSKLKEILEKMEYGFSIKTGLGEVTENYIGQEDALHKIMGSAVIRAFKGEK